MKKRILIIGNADSIWLKEYIKNIHCELQNKVTVVTFNNISYDMQKEYQDMKVNVLVFCNNGINRFINVVKILIYVLRNRKLFEYLEIHYPPSTIQAYFLTLIEKIIYAKKIIVFWGSDLLRVKKTNIKRLRWIIDESDLINLPTEELVNQFEVLFDTKYKEKYISAPFGSLAFEEQKKIYGKLSKADCKRKTGIEENKTTIAIGYNGKKEQQHVKVIKSISEMSKEFKKKCVLILHIIDIADQDYYDEIIEVLNKCGIEFIIIENRLALNEIAVLRRATDIFIQAQITDALSGTIREVLYSGTILINPSWIKYREFDKIGIEYLQYDNIDDIADIVVRVLDGTYTVDIKKNKEKIYNSFSWKAVIDKWQRIYNEEIN